MKKIELSSGVFCMKCATSNRKKIDFFKIIFFQIQNRLEDRSGSFLKKLKILYSNIKKIKKNLIFIFNFF